MFTKDQVQLARTLWEQSRAATAQAHQAWDMVMKTQKGMLDQMRSVAPPFAAAADQFDKLMQFHEQQYKAALEQMDKMSAEFLKSLDKQAGK